MSPSAMQVKNQWKTISTEEKLDVTHWLEKGEWILDMCHNVRLASSCACPNCDSATTIKETAMSGMNICVARLSQSYRYEQYQKLWMSLTFLLH